MPPKPTFNKTDFSGKEKAAMLCVALGPEIASEIFKYLKDEEMEELTLEIANLRFVNAENKEKVIQEFYEICLAQEFIAEGGISYAKTILEKALGPEKAIDVLNRLTVSLQVKPFDFVRKADPSQLLNFIQNEHPQTIALILAYLKPAQSAAVLSSLPVERQADVARRIAKMDRTSPEVIKEVERILEKKLSSLVNQDFTVIGGVPQIVEILNNVDRGTERHIMEALEIDDTELAEDIKKRMFVFEDILLLDNRSIQRFLREVENSMLALALKMATEELKEAMFKNVSKRMGDTIKEDMEFMGPVRIKDVEDAQQGIVNIIRKLEEAGEIIISRGGGDEVIV
jgi:flagellar motor switch protein FliG